MLKPISIDASLRREMQELRLLHQARQWSELETRLLAGIGGSPSDFLSLIRHAGLFRPSHASFEVSHLTKTVQACRAQHTTAAPGDAEGQLYFRSLEALLDFVVRCEREVKRLHRALRDDPAGCVMGMAGELGLAFLAQEDPELGERYELSRAAEPVELADAMSLAIQMLLDAGKPMREFVGLMDIHLADKGYYRQLLDDFVALQSFRDCEVLVDRLGFVAVLERDGWLSVSSPDDTLAKSVAHGFATHLVSQFNWVDEFDARKKSLRGAIRERWPKDHKHFARIESKPFPRLRVNVPMPLVEALGSIKALLPEEAAILASESMGMLTEPNELLTVEVTNGLSVGDLLLGQRILRLASVLILEGLLREPVQPRVVALRSMLPTFSANGLAKAIEPAIGAEKAEKFCRVLLDRAGVDAPFDILYQPAFGARTALAVPMPVAQHANLIRNGLKRWGERPPSLRGPTLESLLRRLLDDAGGVVAQGVKVKGKHGEGEIDVLAQVDGRLFMFECKSGLFPGGFLELQPILDQLEKGSLQLQRMSTLLTDPATMAATLRSLGWTVEKLGVAPVAAVVTNTRMLAGSSLWGIPIHSWLEIENYVLHGAIRVGDKLVRMREEGKLSAIDLAAFVAGVRVHARTFAFLRPHFKERQLGEVGIREPEVVLLFESEAAIVKGLSSWRTKTQ